MLGGCGLGLGYVSPVSTLIRWFPDRRGLASGLAICGFGGGAMLGTPLIECAGAAQSGLCVCVRGGGMIAFGSWRRLCILLGGGETRRRYLLEASFIAPDFLGGAHEVAMVTKGVGGARTSD